MFEKIAGNAVIFTKKTLKIKLSISFNFSFYKYL